MMEKKVMNVVVIDDHRMFTKQLKDIIQEVGEKESMRINTVEVHSSAQAMDLLEQTSLAFTIDFVFLDIKLPDMVEKNIITGEDIGLLIKKKIPKSKIVVVTTYSEPYRIGTLIKQLDPAAFLIKSDLDPKDIYFVIRKILTGVKYYSPTAFKVLESYMRNDYNLDEIDRRILYELASGANLSEIAEIVPLSRSALAKRKSQLRIRLNVKSAENRKLIETARELGLI
ncbi:response regulator [Galbibacter sp.]|uniref:response regulator n=1 Tax=Galbibacter sp. TaxID=2918471 RepID=UPI003A8E7D9E